MFDRGAGLGSLREQFSQTGVFTVAKFRSSQALPASNIKESRVPNSVMCKCSINLFLFLCGVLKAGITG